LGDRKLSAEMNVVELVFVAAEGLAVPLGLDAYIPAPESKPITREKVALGRELFFDSLLSRDRSVSCATCHDPKRAFTDGRARAVGVFGRQGTRRAPAILNRAYGRSFFWDGRVVTLEEQVLQPIANPKEMDLTLDEAAARVAADPRYAARVRSPDDLARALASYVRTILAGDSPYDRYVAGVAGGLAGEALAGLRLFRGKANCVACHVGPNLTDESFHNTGVDSTDPGRFAVSGRDEDRGAFKTPTLREAARTAPYMHNGSLATLDDVIEHYDRGGKPGARVDPEIRPLNLTAAEKRALVAFLQALAGSLREGW
ncbi:MAG: cytochrome-c peroxidase, partial [Bryobacteraceae bacterium]